MLKSLAAIVAALSFAVGPTSGAVASPSSERAVAGGPVLISGVDLHDSTIKKFGDTFYMYGSMYACGYQWYITDTPFCGFGVSTAPTLNGPWTAPKLLFSPDAQDPYSKRSWAETCGGTGQGCFNPRMIQRTGWGSDDGVFVLWFNAPRQYSEGATSAYNVMGCAGPEGPCGPGATPNGSYTKPGLTHCKGANGDFGIIDRPGARPAIICSLAGASGLGVEELNWWGSGGSGVGVTDLAGMDHVEGPGGWWDEDDQKWVVTYSAEGCGYCAGTPIGYAEATGFTGPWLAPGNVGWGAPGYARRTFDTSSCGGQPRTVTVIDGQPWQIIDLWLGTRNEAAADTYLVPLEYTAQAGQPGDGAVWRPPLDLKC